MMKMAHATLPQLICKPVNTSTMCPSNFTSSLSDVLQSDPVKRLLSQPNIVIKTVPLNANRVSNTNTFVNKTYNTDSNVSRPKQSELSIIPVQMNREENNIEDENLLPSKKQGKSEITLVPVKKEKKHCGHYEPCENIVCDVTVQECVDDNGLFPMLAVNIEEDEIDAPVSKHCTNEMCDALSIDHNRCRRAVIRLNRCNRSTVCDICGISLKTKRSRISHKICTRKNEYRHNEISSATIMKERMREREIQILEASKLKKNDYLDPVTGYGLAMETLRKNKEIVITTKSVPQQQQPMITINSMAATQPQINNMNNVFGKLLPNMPIVLPQQNIGFDKTQDSNKNNVTTPVQLTLQDTVTKSSTVPLPQNQYIAFTTPTNTQSIPINELFLPQSQVVTMPIQPKPLLTSIRVVPITNLITKPSLLHQMQGIPKFCIMSDNATHAALTIPNPVPIMSDNTTKSNPIPIMPKGESIDESKPPLPKKAKTLFKKRRKIKRKEFKCEYCLKSFSTDWYFKIHIAMHTGEKRFPCKICSKSFNNRYDMKRHMLNDHDSDYVAPNIRIRRSDENSSKSLDCNDKFTSDDKKECDENVEKITIKSPNVMEEVTTKLSSNVTETKINNLDLLEEVKKDDKTNGYICMPTQDVVKNIKTELCNEV